jgi:hypothetical protein
MADYYTIITDEGQALLADAIANGTTVQLTQFGVGDGGGAPVTPDPTMTALTNEVYRGSISNMTTSPVQPDAMVAQLIVPKESGGYIVREVALFTDTGVMFSIGNYPDQPKPPTNSGYAVKLDLRYVLAVSDTSAITVVIQPGDYLTKEQADTLYLKIGFNLSEIEDAGPDAQLEARNNIDAAPRSDLYHYYSKHRVNQTSPSEVFNRLGNQFSRGSYLFKLATYATTGQTGTWYVMWVNSSGVLNLTLLWETSATAENTPELFIDNNRLYVRTTDPDTLYDVMVAIEECDIDAAHRVFDFYTKIASRTYDNEFEGQQVINSPEFITKRGNIYDDQLATNLVQGYRLEISSTRYADIYLHEDIGTGLSFKVNLVLDGVGHELTFRNDGTLALSGHLYAGDATYSTNGDVYGPIWSNGWLSSFINNSLVHDIRLGAEYGDYRLDEDWAYRTQSGYVITGFNITSDDGQEDNFDAIFSKPIQKLVSGAWWNIGEGSVVSISEMQYLVHESKVPESGLSQLINLSPYYNKKTPSGCVDFIDENGYLWSYAQKKIKGSVFIMYDMDDVIHSIASDISTFRPENLSVAGLDEIPPGFKIDGSWKFNGVNIYKDITIINAKTEKINSEKLSISKQRAITEIMTLQTLSATGNAQSGDAQALKAWTDYLVKLSQITDLVNPDWPPAPQIKN